MHPYHLFRITSVYLVIWVVLLLIAPAHVVDVTFGVALDGAIQQLLNTIIFLATAIAIMYWILPQSADEKTQLVFILYSAIFWSLSTLSSALPILVGMRELNPIDSFRAFGALSISCLYIYYLWRQKHS